MRFLALGLVILFGCASPDGDDPPVGNVEQALYVDGGTDNYEWIRNPASMPPGHRGKSNCTFAFGGSGCQLGVYEDSGCWERETDHDGWIRQQGHRSHCTNLSTSICPSKVGDVWNIRICRGPGQDSPCGRTGPNGCAVCESTFVCH